jgi:prolyl oligopeptidase
LPEFFHKLPRLTYGIRAIPAYAADSAPAAYYQSGSETAGRPGWFCANTSNLASRPKWQMQVLTLHESVPGHHLQLSLAQEMENVPEFRKYSSYTAFAEGWALYCEHLGTDMGFYKDPYSKFGQLTFEMWRACRLVIDTGIHSQGWSRQQAIDYLMTNAGKDEHEATVEIDRYIASPGQALAYKVGQLNLLALRDEAVRELGDKFDLRSFHDALLANGSLPLPILDDQMKAWIATQKTAAPSP